MATLRQAKATLRQEMKQKLANITKEEKDRQSDIVIKKVPICRLVEINNKPLA